MIILFFLLFTLLSCSSSETIEGEIFARVGEEVLLKKNIVDKTGGGLVNSNSVLHFTNKWVKKTLLYEAALNANLDKDGFLIEKKENFYKDLLVSSFLELEAKKQINITKKEISDYYRTHKKSFTRNEDEIRLKHFVLPTKSEAVKLKKLLKSNKKGALLEEYIYKYKPETKTVKKNLVGDNIIGFIFNHVVGDIIGPKKIDSSYHVFEVLRKKKKGTIKGLEIVYDEIQQRLFKKKEAVFLTFVLDSLYLNADIYISPEVNK
tara:strand:- start:1067 stop:1855 length:789 start_codon:yes stop_codon:yes gene_type:complete